MHSNQTLQLKPSYQHSHIIYNTPIIGIAPDVHIIHATNGPSISNDQDIANINTLATIQSIPTSVSSVNGTTRILHSSSTIVSANGVCLNNVPSIQQLQVQISSQIAPSASVAMIDMGCGANSQNVNHLALRSGNDNNFQDGPTSSRSSSSTSEANFIEAISSDNSKGPTTNDRSKVSLNGQCDRATKSSDDVIYAIASDQSGTSRGNNETVGMDSKDSCKDEPAMNRKSTSRPKGFKCQICDRDFTQKGNLKTHLMTHSGERPYECHTCGKNFTQKGNLDTHVKIHTDTKDHRCQYCDRGFTQRGNLKTHIRSVHTKEKPYVCDHCGKCFSQRGNMVTHFRTHDKEARFPCNLCGKTFSQKVSRRWHILS